MKFHVITLFPEWITQTVRLGLVGQAIDRKLIEVHTYNPRKHTSDVHHSVDDRPFGGSDGMLMTVEPLEKSLIEAKQAHAPESSRVIHLSPRGQLLNDEKVKRLSRERNIILISSRYAGVDQRFINQYVDEEISIGDYILSGGELAASVMIDTISRHIPGVLGNKMSSVAESFSEHRLEAPQFTRPRLINGAAVPAPLLSGDHAKMKKFDEALRTLVTLWYRPDMIAERPLGEREKLNAVRTLEELSEVDLRTCGLPAKTELQKLLEVF